MASVFGSAAMAAGYARSRPGLHARILERAIRASGARIPVSVAVDVGCGSGLSTEPLSGIARLCTGLDPVEAMVKLAPAIALGASFAAAEAEHLPLQSKSVDLITAAGSLNYVDTELFFREASRVTVPDGILIVYDFGRGATFRDGPQLTAWFRGFMARYPDPPHHANDISPEWLAAAHSGFRVVASERFQMGLTMSMHAYADYIMTETNVAHAVRRGAGESEIRQWCRTTLAGVFEDTDREVLFPGYFCAMAR